MAICTSFSVYPSQPSHKEYIYNNTKESRERYQFSILHQPSQPSHPIARANARPPRFIQGTSYNWLKVAADDAKGRSFGTAQIPTIAGASVLILNAKPREGE